MKILHRWTILAGLLLAALISYVFGFSQGIAVFVILGVAFELAFWFGIFGKMGQSNQDSGN